MATTTTAIDFLEALLVELRAALPGVQVEASWPGPDVTEKESVFFGPAIDPWDVELANISAGRKHRQETYTVTVEVWVATPGELRAESKIAGLRRAMELTEAIGNLLADKPRLIPSIQYAELTARPATSVPFATGWSSQVAVSIEVHARLT